MNAAALETAAFNVRRNSHSDPEFTCFSETDSARFLQMCKNACRNRGSLTSSLGCVCAQTLETESLCAVVDMNRKQESATLTQDQLVQINQVCNVFEREWRDGRRLRVEDLFGSVGTQDLSAYLGELLPLEAEYRQQTDDPLTVEECQTRFPDVDADWLQAAIRLDDISSDLSRTNDNTTPDESTPTVENYDLLERIGEGGFGIVYRARQLRPIRRMVALKVIRPGMDSEQVIARFEAERQAMAIMDHPNIASVFDAGTTENGRPYFAMELVQGIPITQYCDQCKLTVVERLDLFVRVCLAVQHAHQKGVIHRDIKPTNVLVSIVDGNPEPKIIDFGVAKAISQRLTEATLLTGFAQILGTPLYMSPEQAEMSVLDVDTRSDVFALGVLLYELLTGSTPIEKTQLAQATFDEVRRLIREEDPPLPSARLSTLDASDTCTLAEYRRADARQFVRAIRGDLDWIVMKAMEKDRTRRYESASALAEDVKRHLDNRPVEAGAPSLTYRFAKFTRRNRTPILAVGTIIACLLVSTVVSVRQATLATKAQGESEIASREAQAVADFLVDAFRSPDPSVDGRNVTVAEVLDRAVLTLPQRFTDDSREKASMLHALGETYLGSGLPGRAVDLLEQAHEIRSRLLGKDHPATLETADKLANSYLDKGSVGDAVEIATDTLEKSNANPEMRIRSMQMLADAYIEDGQENRGIEWERKVFESYKESLGGDHPRTLTAMERYANTLNILGMRHESLKLLEESAEMRRERMGATHPDTLNTAYLLAVAYWEAGEREKSSELHGQTLARLQATLGEKHPAGYKHLLAIGNQHVEKSEYQLALEAYKKLLLMNISDTRKMLVLNYLAFTETELGLYSDALNSYRTARLGWKEIALPNVARKNTLYRLGSLLARHQKWAEAREVLEEQLTLESHLTQDGASMSALRLGAILAWQYDENARIDLAQHLLDRLESRTELTCLDRIAKPLIVCPLENADSELTQEIYRIAELIGDQGKEHYHQVYFRCLRGMMEYRRGNFAESRRWLTPLRSCEVQHCCFLAHTFLAMIEFRLGNFEKSKTLLADSDGLVELLPGVGEDLAGADWQDRIFNHLVHREASELILSKQRTEDAID